jgi:hypothetical protein
VLVHLMRDFFNIYSESTTRPASVRFVGSPYNTFLPGCPTMQITAHHRGSKVSPHCIEALLNKFGIGRDAFLSAHDAFSSNQLRLNMARDLVN